MEPENGTSVVLLHNQVGEDRFERLRSFDASTLEFEPRYRIADVATCEEEYEAIAAALRSEGFRVSILNRLVTSRRPDVVFNLLEYFKDDPELDAPVAGLFDLHEIPYTGASSFAPTLCQRKALVKQLFSANGSPTPRYEILHEPDVGRPLVWNPFLSVAMRFWSVTRKFQPSQG